MFFDYFFPKIISDIKKTIFLFLWVFYAILPNPDFKGNRRKTIIKMPYFSDANPNPPATGGGKFRDLSGFSADFSWAQKVHFSSHKHDLHIFRVCFDWKNKLGGLWKAFDEFRMHFGYDKLAYVGHLLPQGRRIQISRIFPFLSSLSQRHQKGSSDRFYSPQKASLSIT